MALFALYDALSKPLEPSRLLAALEYALAERRGDRPILVVNDNAADRDLIRRALKRQGYPVE
jgi:CheY-like chemotaxis protein